MRTIFAVPLCWLLVLLIGCGQSENKDRLKEKARGLAVTAAETLSKWEKGDFSDFRAQLRGLRKSLEDGDYSQAREFTQKMDAALETEVVSKSIEFLKTESTEGAEKAAKAMDDYMASRQLAEHERKALTLVLQHIKSIEKRDVPGLVGAVVYIALEHKMSHSAALPASLAVVVTEELLGTGAHDETKTEKPSAP